MALELEKVVKDKKVYPVLLKWSIARHSDEQVGFIADTSNNEKLYTKWVSPASPKQVNLKGPIQLPLEELAKAKKWKAMDSLMKQAKEFVADAFDKDEMLAFERSPQYLALVTPPRPTTPAPKLPAKPVAPPRPVTPAPNPVAIATAKSITQMNTDMAAGTTFLKSAMASVKSKGLPADQIEVNRMFDSARMRHDKVHEEFTERVQKDKAFTRATQAAFFKKKDEFSKLWADYRKLLKK
jgi:hypothetical protein